MSRKRSNKLRGFLIVIYLILLGVAGFALYDLAQAGMTSFFAFLGITNQYIVLSSIVLIALLVLGFSGYGLIKGLKRLAR